MREINEREGEMTMKKYSTPNMEILTMDACDVIRTSFNLDENELPLVPLFFD